MTLNRALILFFAVIGVIASLFLPWVHYPKLENHVLYGRMGDGWLTALFFLLVALFILFKRKKSSIKKGWLTLISIIGLVLAGMSIQKVQTIEDQKTNFNSENPIFDIAAAGFYQGSGLYLFGIAGLGILLCSLILLFEKGPNVNSETKPFINSKSLGIASVVLCALLSFYFLGSSLSSSKADSVLAEAIEKGIEEMGEALINQDIEAFVAFNHPIVVQSFGGKEKMTELMQSSVQELKLSGNIIRDISMLDILDIQEDASSIQALVAQSVEAEFNGEIRTEIQNIIAVSEDNGSNWYFINTYDNSRDELEKVFPQLNPKLQF